MPKQNKIEESLRLGDEIRETRKKLADLMQRYSACFRGQPTPSMNDLEDGNLDRKGKKVRYARDVRKANSLKVKPAKLKRGGRFLPGKLRDTVVAHLKTKKEGAGYGDILKSLKCSPGGLQNALRSLRSDSVINKGAGKFGKYSMLPFASNGVH